MKRFIQLAMVLVLAGCGGGGASEQFTGGMVIASPSIFQVFQRRTGSVGSIRIHGSLTATHDRLECMFAGSSVNGPLPSLWEPLQESSPGAFDVTRDVAAGGWYRLDIRAWKGTDVVATGWVNNFGVGEVFVGAGQSNSTNWGEGRTAENSEMVSTFDGIGWRLANDPMPGVRDQSDGGSFWPTLGDLLYQRYHVPIGVASTGQSGSSITSWAAHEDLYKWTLNRIHQLGPGGFRALLWHQGESDIDMTTDAYANDLRSLILSSRKDAGWDFPWMVARVSYDGPSRPRSNSTRDGQKRMWDEGIALEGPDTDTLTGINRSANGTGRHFSTIGLRAHGNLWAEKVSAYLDNVLGP